jgi:glycosyltransferase involved in cell wall biosynthesis
MLLRWRGRRDGLDLFHGPNFRIRTQGLRGALVTIHDLWLDRFPQYSPKMFGQRLSFYRTRRTAWSARKVIAVSQHTARDIQELFGLPADRIVVIPNGVSAEFHPAEDPVAMEQFRRRFRLPTGRFILFVGGADPRKNHRTLLQACAGRRSLRERCSLVLVGDEQHRFGSFRKTAAELGLQHNIVCTGRLTVDMLRLLYSHADVFVFPSLYEGFGIPVLEAMACGAPVITSNTTSLPEVAGEAALLVDPTDADGLGRAVSRVLDDEALRKHLIAKGCERVKLFPWSRAAQETMALYRELCAG